MIERSEKNKTKFYKILSEAKNFNKIKRSFMIERSEKK